MGRWSVESARLMVTRERKYRRWSRTKSREEDGMSFQRRQLLQILSYAFGSSFILPQNRLAIAEQKPAQPASPAPPAKATAKRESGGTKMEKVAGIGGLFFRAHDPKALGNWYQQHLGIT